MSETDPGPLAGLAVVFIELKNAWIGRPSLAVSVGEATLQA